MERRAFLAVLGASALPPAPAAAAAGKAAPPQPEIPNNDLATLAALAARSVPPAKACLRYCFDRLAAKEADFADCARAASDLVAGADALSALAAAGAPFAAGFARTVADLAAACKKECDRFAQIAECKACGEACAALAEGCRKAAQ